MAIAEYSIGSRVRHPKMKTWGKGQVMRVNGPNLTVFFEGVGEKMISTKFIELALIDGYEAESDILDRKFNKRRSAHRPFRGSEYFNDGKSASRKQYIQSLGGTCANWTWSWSFTNHEERKIFFGGWLDLTSNGRTLIFSEDWRIKRDRHRPAWSESRENIRLIEEEGYSLYVYTMIEDPSSISEDPERTRKIGAIKRDLAEARLMKDGDEWYAVYTDVTL